MKMNILILAFLNIFFSVSCGSFQKEINYVPIGEIIVSNVINLGCSESELHIDFGNPDSIVKYYTPVIDEFPTYYHYYGKSYFKIIEDHVTGFEIVDKKMSLLGLKVGDSKEKLAKKFPSSYSKRYSAGEDRRSYEVTKVGVITKSGEKSDSFFILFRVKENKILSIEYWENT